MNKVESFSYVVTSTNVDIGTMEISYSSPGLPDVLVGARMPRGTQTLDQVVAEFAPMTYWGDILNPVIPVEVGASSVVTLSTDEQPRIGLSQPISTGSQAL